MRWGLLIPGPLPLQFQDKQTQVDERLISREYFKEEVHQAAKRQFENPNEVTLLRLFQTLS